jgi:hypothetical protein
MNLELIIDSLEELSDEKFHTALWSGKMKGMQSSFTEAVCILFDDSGLGIELDSGDFERNHSSELYLSVCSLRVLLREIDDSGTPEQTLRNPKMRQVREAANALKKLFTDYHRHLIS